MKLGDKMTNKKQKNSLLKIIDLRRRQIIDPHCLLSFLQATPSSPSRTLERLFFGLTLALQALQPYLVCCLRNCRDTRTLPSFAGLGVKVQFHRQEELTQTSIEGL